MDYPYSFQTAPQPYQFLGLPPTPSHTNSAHSDDFSNGSPPDQYEQFQQFEFGFNTHTHNQNHNHNHNVIQQPVKPPTPQSHHKPSISGMNANLHQNQDANDDSRQQRGGSNSDDDENMTPAQSRRKAQNRAAQRAFRERKERHVKDLEAKLAALTSSSTNLSTENELLRQQLQRASTENEILRATSGRQHNSASPPPSTGPMRYSPKDFYTDVLEPHDNKTISHRVSKGESGERLLAAGATWDYIINSEQYKRGLVDVGDISERLKTRARCDGQGPVFEERVIREAIEQSVASGNDELL